MPKDAQQRQKGLQRKRLLEEYSNYGNTVTLIASLEQWFDHRWGASGTEHSGLLEAFDRFPLIASRRPDFEVRFRTPYALIGECKKVLHSKETSDDLDQVMAYATHSETRLYGVPCDVLVLVNSENDDKAAESLMSRCQWPTSTDEHTVQVRPIVVLGCYLDAQGIHGEWYKLKWRGHYQNHRFHKPNICNDGSTKDLNALIADAESSFHPIPVNRSAVGRAGRSPFINDPPPALYTVDRLVVPVLSGLLTDEDRDELQATGKVVKVFAKADILGSDLVARLDPKPPRLDTWVETALDCLVATLKWAELVEGTHPKQYRVMIDGKWLKRDIREWGADRAAAAAVKTKISRRRSRRGRDIPYDPTQAKMFK